MPIYGDKYALPSLLKKKKKDHQILISLSLKENS